MLNKKVDEIIFKDLDELKENEIPEDKKLDYKCTLPKFLLIPSRDEEAKKAKKPHIIEFLKDVSAFANTSGGHLLYGIKSENGVPTDICGVDVGGKEDAYIRQLDQLLDGQLDPRIHSGSKEIGFIDLEPPKKEKVLAIYVSKSWRAPHRVKPDGQFYKRSGRLNPTMDVDDLRIAFTVSESIIRNTRRFKEERIRELKLNNAPVQFLSYVAEDPLPPSDDESRGRIKVILHLIPFDWFTSTNYVDVKKAYDNYEKMMPMNWRGNDYSSPNRYNIDGVLVYDQDRYGNTRSYTQLYRNGIIEAVEGGKYVQYGGISIYSFEKQLKDAIRNYLEILQLLELDTPIFLFLTLLGMKDVVLLSNSKQVSNHAIDRDELDIPEACVKSYTEDLEDVYRNVFGALWNACGEERPEK